MKVWYPTARVQLILRVDTLEDLDAFANPDSGASTVALSAGDRETNLAENRSNRDETIRNRENTPPDVFSLAIADSDREREEIYATAEVGSEKSLDSDPDVVKFWVIPKSVSVEKNNLSDADKCTIELDYRSLPFDPRAFRFAAVRVVIGSVSAEDYAAGIIGGGSQLELSSIVPPETTRWFSLTGNSRFVGFVDEWMVEFDDSGERVTLQCRDISAVLRDTEVPTSQGIDLDKGIRVGIAELLSKFTSMKEVRVVYGNPVFPLEVSKLVNALEGIDGPIPRGTVEAVSQSLTAKELELQQIISAEGLDIKVTTTVTNAATGETTVNTQPSLLPKVSDGLYNEDIVKQASKGGSPKKKSKKKNVAKNKADKTVKIWDHILEICFKMGLLPIMRGNILFLASPRDVFSGVFGRRQMIWGGNISRLRMARKAGSSDAIGKGVQIICYDPRLGRSRWARFPVKPGEPDAGILGKQGSPQPVNTRAVEAGVSKGPTDSFISYPISGIRSEERLVEIAESIFHRIARQEVEIAIETEDLASAGFSREPDNVEETDLLGLQSGDSIIVDTLRTAASTPAAVLNPEGSYRPNNFLDISAMTFGERVNFLQSIGFRSDVAQKLAGSQETGDIQRTFRVNHVSISWNKDDGVKISIDAINFIEARINKFLGSNKSEPDSSLLAGAGEAFV